MPATTNQQAALQIALENLKTTSELATQALRDAAMKAAGIGHRGIKTQILGAIESAQHQLEKARANLAVAWLETSDEVPCDPDCNAKGHVSTCPKITMGVIDPNASTPLPPIPVPDNGWDQSVTYGDECFLCGKRNKKTGNMAQVVYSPQDWCLYDPHLLDDQAVGGGKELGVAWVGPDCIKKIPKGYVA